MFVAWRWTVEIGEKFSYPPARMYDTRYRLRWLGFAPNPNVPLLLLNAWCAVKLFHVLLAALLLLLLDLKLAQESWCNVQVVWRRSDLLLLPLALRLRHKSRSTFRLHAVALSCNSLAELTSLLLLGLELRPWNGLLLFPRVMERAGLRNSVFATAKMGRDEDFFITSRGGCVVITTVVWLD